MKVIDYVKQFLSINNIIEISISTDCKEGSTASYNFETNVLEVNEDSLLTFSIRHEISIEDAVSLIISHELGHYLDDEIPKLIKQKRSVFDKIKKDIFSCDFEEVINEGTSYVLKAEENAWSLGEGFVPSHLIDKYLELRKETLIRQENATRNEFIEYINLVLRSVKLKYEL